MSAEKDAQVCAHSSLACRCWSLQTDQGPSVGDLMSGSVTTQWAARPWCRWGGCRGAQARGWNSKTRLRRHESTRLKVHRSSAKPRCWTMKQGWSITEAKPATRSNEGCDGWGARGGSRLFHDHGAGYREVCFSLFTNLHICFVSFIMYLLRLKEKKTGKIEKRKERHMRKAEELHIP